VQVAPTAPPPPTTPAFTPTSAQDEAVDLSSQDSAASDAERATAPGGAATSDAAAAHVAPGDADTRPSSARAPSHSSASVEQPRAVTRADRTDVQPTAEPTVEPTMETVVIDVSDDPNARSERTPVAVNRAAAPTATAEPSPTAAPLGDHDLISGVVQQTLEPMLVGGRLGLLGAGASALGLLAMRFARRRR
jgi:hypothetical protein